MQPCITLIANTIVGVLVEAQANRATASGAAILATVSAMPVPSTMGMAVRSAQPAQQFILNLGLKVVRHVPNVVTSHHPQPARHIGGERP